ncbi:PREDICTED: phospholipid scramblase 1-like isoform X2 [Rhinopithecus bieti]|uniref:phospholipid scramblase 1-like isoform X2 n=1 Tax=Rhinopithecus bieti TaxID=61621 RepID=UPI00083BC2EA|nr:PREDICTED: phospholipid scramblase 1-like isoform X2 [Rhinopithecus bieti]
MAIYDLRPWLSTPETITSCPPGLEYLYQTNQLTVCQDFDPLGGRDVLALHKALKCSCCWSRCCLQKLKVEAPPGETIGYVYQYFHPFLPKFKIKNENKEEVMKIRGPWLVFSCLRDLNFNLLTLDEEMVIGKISKQYSGFVRGILTNGEKFGIQFPFDLDVKIKALMLGATFLIDYMYFELWP